MRRTWHLLAVLLVLALAATACSKPAQPAGGGSAAGPKVGVFVADAFGDRAFFDIALNGKKLVEQNYGARVTTYEGQLKADNFVTLLSDGGRDNDIVFVLGFEAIDAMLTAAERNANANFVFIDAPLPDTPSVSSIGYKDHEGCFLAGALAAMITNDTSISMVNPQKVVGFVGGMDVPVIRRCEAGYIQGARYVDAEVKVETLFVGAWTDPAKGKEVNLTLRDKGSDINYQYAGLSGEGGFNAAKENSGIYAIGAGFDQSWLAPGYVPGSMLKKVDLTIDLVTKRYLDGVFKKGTVENHGLVENGLGMVYDDKLVSADKKARLEAIEKSIRSGEIQVLESLQ